MEEKSENPKAREPKEQEEDDEQPEVEHKTRKQRAELPPAFLEALEADEEYKWLQAAMEHVDHQADEELKKSGLDLPKLATVKEVGLSSDEARIIVNEFFGNTIDEWMQQDEKLQVIRREASAPGKVIAERFFRDTQVVQQYKTLVKEFRKHFKNKCGQEWSMGLGSRDETPPPGFEQKKFDSSATALDIIEYIREQLIKVVEGDASKKGGEDTESKE